MAIAAKMKRRATSEKIAADEPHDPSRGLQSHNFTQIRGVSRNILHATINKVRRATPPQSVRAKTALHSADRGVII